jgi:hypothetical protein
MKPSTPPFKMVHFFTCSDHVQQLSENNFQMKIAEVSQIIEEKKSSLLLV